MTKLIHKNDLIYLFIIICKIDIKDTIQIFEFNF